MVNIILAKYQRVSIVIVSTITLAFNSKHCCASSVALDLALFRVNVACGMVGLRLCRQISAGSNTSV